MAVQTVSFLTLLEAAKLGNGTTLQRTVVEIFARQSQIMRLLPFTTISGNSFAYTIEDALPNVGFRAVNEGFSVSFGVINPMSEVLKIVGGDIIVDNFIINTEGQQSVTNQVNFKLKAIAEKFQRSYFKGDDSADPRELRGLQNRIGGDQLIPVGNAALGLDTIDLAIDEVQNGPQYLMMNKSLARKLSQAARKTTVGGNVVYGTDEFGRRITEYDGVPVIPLESLAGKDDILPFTEDNGSGGNDASSLYLIRYGEDLHHGIQHTTGLMVRNLGEIEAQPANLTRVEWYVGIVLKNPRAVVRISQILNLAFTQEQT